MLKQISSNNAPAAIGPYSQAIGSENMIFCSGQLGINPSTGKLCDDSIEKQAEQVFKNMKAVLDAAEVTLSDVVKTTVFLTSMRDFPVLNTLYAAAFGNHKPARSTVQVAALPLGAKVEIECIAVKLQ
ncbi:MAG: RidA family protein [Chitinispirillaceae bacterium]|nr:RidA family protein [Chitinispirillaceae bacterium]